MENLTIMLFVSKYLREMQFIKTKNKSESPMIHFRIKAYCMFIIGVFLITSCSDSSVNAPSPEKDISSDIESILMSRINNSDLAKAKDLNSIDLKGVSSFDGINTMLKDNGANIRLAYAETVTKQDNSNHASGQTIFANDRTKQLTAQWVSNDNRRNADGNTLNYIVWDLFAPANFGLPNQFDGTTAIDASFDTWDTVKNKSKLDIIKRPNTPSNPSFILGGNPFLADISQVGFLPGIFFEAYVGTGSSENVLGVTFTFVFIDGEGNPTDINNDGFSDVALKEVWYNDDFVWTDSGNTATEIDLETVALHENGHALGFGHFGKISVTNNNKLHVSPRSVMNAIILGTQRTLLGTDKASYKSIYGNWPTK